MKLFPGNNEYFFLFIDVHAKKVCVTFEDVQRNQKDREEDCHSLRLEGKYLYQELLQKLILYLVAKGKSEESRVS